MIEFRLATEKGRKMYAAKEVAEFNECTEAERATFAARKLDNTQGMFGGFPDSGIESGALVGNARKSRPAKRRESGDERTKAARAGARDGISAGHDKGMGSV